LFGDPVLFLITSIFLIPALLLAIPAHELGHAYAADRLGDHSVRGFGYLKPQVRRFLDTYGVIAVFLANIAWGRPAPIQAGRIGYAGVRRALYSAAGPATNLALAVILGIALRFLFAAGIFPRPTGINPVQWAAFVVYAAYFLNLAMFAFQLLPIPGLDGWEIVAAFFRRRNPAFFMRAEQNRQTIWMVCLIVIFIGPLLLKFSLLGAVVGILFEPASYLILGQCVGYTSLNPCPV
jgi:Zn-dependent protease